jgi:methyl-accepting chemotaxis protein
VVQQNAANAEENAAASEEMNAQAIQMQVFVGDLFAIVGSNGNGKKGYEDREAWTKAPSAIVRSFAPSPYRVSNFNVVSKRNGKQLLRPKLVEKRPDRLPLQDPELAYC